MSDTTTRTRPISALRVDDWIRWGVGGLIAGLVAYGSVGNRMTAMETEMRVRREVSADERAADRKAITDLTIEVAGLKEAFNIDHALSAELQRQRRESQQSPSSMPFYERGLPKFGPPR